MPGTTARRALPYPLGTEVPDGPAAFLALANALDKDLFFLTPDTLANRPAASLEGRVYRATDVATSIFYDNGTTWLTIQTGGPWMPTAGGLFTGDVNYQDHVLQRPEILDAAETARVVATSGASQTIDYAVAAIQDLTMSADCVLSFTNPPASGKSGSLLIIIRQGATLRAVTWPASVKWANGAAPVMVINTVNILSFVTVDGGSNWYGFVAGLDHH